MFGSGFPTAPSGVQVGGAPAQSLTFAGAGVSVSNDGAGNMTVTIPGGGGGGGAPLTGDYTCASGIAVGQWVYDATGAVLLADARDPAKRAIGVVAAKADATHCTVTYSGEAGVFSGLTVDADYYLSTTPGAMTTTPPSGDGTIVQFLCRSRSTATAIINPDPLTDTVHP